MADWMKPAPHQWEMVPSTKTEIRHEMNARESRHTCMLWPKRYQDIDTGKFDSDKMETIFSQSLGDLWNYRYYDNHYYFDRYGSRDDRYPDAWFVPKDNDFDKEEELYQKKKEEERLAAEKKERDEKEKKEYAEALKRYAEERLRLHNLELEKQRRLKQEQEAEIERLRHAKMIAENEYLTRVREAEERAMRQFNQNREIEMERWANRTNIRPNCWRPK